MTIDVRYPSGRRFTVTGIWRGPQRVLSEPNMLGTEADCVFVERGDGALLALDPRGTFTDRATGHTLYRGLQ
jgi:hypothetical protein